MAITPYNTEIDLQGRLVGILQVWLEKIETMKNV